MTWKQTYTGLRFELLNPMPDMICIEDIAHALSLTCRFNGHCREFYSVAQHSVLISIGMPTPRAALAGLLHDAAEAYLSDVPSPLKPLLKDFVSYEHELMTLIFSKYGLNPYIPYNVKEADKRMLATEMRDLCGGPIDPWPSLQGVKPYAMTIEPCGPTEAEALFLERFHMLTNEIERGES